MKKLILGILLLVAVLAQAGTAVGNFNFVNQDDFDFRVGYPSSWKWAQVAVTEPDEVEAWLMSNKAVVTDPQRYSSAAFSFIKNFPAKNDQELLAAIQKRHPQLKWKPLSNPDFTIGFVSDQFFINPQRTQSFEYYFSEKNKVVRVESIRDSFQNGAAELDTILSTIRRPSGAPQILAISNLNSNQKQINVGDTFCYKIELDVRRGDFTKENISSFELAGAPEYWSFKSIQWNRTESSMVICTNITRRFASDGLRIQKMSLSSKSGSFTFCSLNSQKELACMRGAQAEIVKYQVPVVNNPHPDLQGPKIKNIRIGAKSNSVEIDVSDESGLQVGVLTLDSSHNPPDKDAVIIYEDQLFKSPLDFEIKEARLFPGYTRVISVKFVDKAGNISQLKSEDGKMNYTLYSSGVPPVETKIPILSVLRGAR